MNGVSIEVSCMGTKFEPSASPLLINFNINTVVHI